MNEYKQELLTKRRGGHCCFGSQDGVHTYLCGCGQRFPVDKEDKNRIVRRVLQRKLRRLIENDD